MKNGVTEGPSESTPFKYSYLLFIPLSIVIGFLWYAFLRGIIEDSVISKGGYIKAGISLSIALLIYILKRLKFKSLLLLSKSIIDVLPKNISKNFLKKQSWFQIIYSFIVGVIIFGFVLHMVISGLIEYPLLMGGVVILLGGLVYMDLQKKARKEINKTVMGDANAENTNATNSAVVALLRKKTFESLTLYKNK